MVSSDDEVGELATSFNAMADAVVREDELRRVFAADVAHDLRTPLTVLRSQLEAVQDGLSAPGPEVIDSLHEEALRLDRLVADLEAMADADAAGFSLERRELVLRPWCATCSTGSPGTSPSATSLSPPTSPRSRPGSTLRVAAGADQPAQQRGQVHPPRRGGDRDLRAARRRRRAGGDRHR